MVDRCITDSCPDCHVGFNGPASEVAKAIAQHRTGKHPDPLLLEAQREVDAMYPHTPPIAPQPSPTYRREEWLASLVVPDAASAQVKPEPRDVRTVRG